MLFNRLIIFISFSLSLLNVSALLPIYTKGYRFIKPSSPDSEDGDVFNVIGVDYQPGGSSAYDSSSGEDVLSDADACLRDAYVLQQLGVNTIRIYTLNPDVNHDECMTILNNAGIYVILDVNSGDYDGSLNRDDPASTYNSGYLTRVFKYIEAFKGYSNVIGFFSGNEVINDETSASVAGPYIRAVQRDMRQYIDAHSNRSIPVGYSAADETSLRLATFKYLSCNIDDQEDDDSKSQFFGLNSYEWCSGISTWATSGYSSLNSTFSNSTIPVFFSEYGCNTDSPRSFDEVTGGLYSGLEEVFSGGLVYEYSQETSNYGLVQINNNGSVSLLQDFNNLKSQFGKIQLANITSSEVDDASDVKCNPDDITSIYSEFGANFTLPSQPQDIQDLIKNSVNATNFGAFISNYNEKTTNYTIYDSSGAAIKDTSISMVSSENEMDLSPSSSATKSSSSSSSVTSASTSGSGSKSSSKGDGVYVGYSTGLFIISFVFNMII